MNAARLLAAACTLLLAGSITAAPLDIGNVAPGAGAVTITVNGVDVGDTLAYGEFLRWDTPATTLDVRVTRVEDGSELFRDRVVLRPRGFGSPMLVFAGNGSNAPWNAYLQEDGFPLRTAAESQVERQPSIGRWNYRLVGINLAAQLQDNPDPAAMLSCQTVAGGRYSSEQIGGVIPRFAQAASLPMFGMEPVDLTDADYRDRQQQCRWRLLGDLPRIEVQGPPRQMLGSVTRVLAIGDGRSEPLSLIEVVDGVVTARSTATPSSDNDNAARSRHLWFDQDRNAQSVSLFEVGAAGLTLGTWQTFAANGRPTWYFIEATTGDTPGRRDVLLRKRERDNDEGMSDIGSGVLLYLDCNSAELRLAFDNGDRRTLRLRRSREVSSCGSILQ